MFSLNSISDMADAWIKGYRLFDNTTVPFDSLEPYSTIVAVTVALPTLITATYVYAVMLLWSLLTINIWKCMPLQQSEFPWEGILSYLCSARTHRGRFPRQILLAFNFQNLFAFLTNLLRFRLALFDTFASFYVFLGDSVWATAVWSLTWELIFRIFLLHPIQICAPALLMPRAQLVAHCLLTANRLLAVLKPLDYDRVCWIFSTSCNTPVWVATKLHLLRHYADDYCTCAIDSAIHCDRVSEWNAEN